MTVFSMDSTAPSLRTTAPRFAAANASERKEADERLRQAEKMELIGQIGRAHV